MTTEAKGGKAIGQEYLVRIRAYLGRTGDLPLLGDGSLNMSAIALAAGIPRQSLYKNPKIRELLEDAKTKCSVKVRPQSDARDNVTAGKETGSETKQTTALERRASQLEQQNAVLVAGNAELRSQLKALRLQIGREDMTIETGFRFPAPPSTHD